MGLEPTTFCLGSKRSTTELHPRCAAVILLEVRSGVNKIKKIEVKPGEPLHKKAASTVYGIIHSNQH